MKLSALAAIVEGQLVGEDIEFSNILVYQNKSESHLEDALLVSLEGNETDPEFLQVIQTSGAKALLISSRLNTPVPCVIVTDTIEALGKFAKFWREQFTLPIIAVTGSCGKSTTVSLLEQILRQRLNVLATSYNNRLGVPFTLLSLNAGHQVAVTEISSVHGNAIRGGVIAFNVAYLTQLIKPTIGIITNVDFVHVKELGNVEAIAKEKAKLIKGLPEKGLAIINADDQFYNYWHEEAGSRYLVTFGIKNPAHVYAKNITFDHAGSHFELHIGEQHVPIHLNLLGEHNIYNVLAAVAASYMLGLTIEEIQQGLNVAEALPSRLKKHVGVGGAIILDDSMVGNFPSIKAGIRVLANYGGKKILVVGDSDDYAEYTQKIHYELGAYAMECGIDEIYATGKQAQFIVQAFGIRARYFENKESLIAALLPVLNPDTVILIEGAPAAEMYKVMAALVGEQSD